MDKFVYDKTLRELFQEAPRALIKLITNKNIKELLDISFPKVEERRVDLLARLEDDTLFHLEIQSVNDKNMPIRMLRYAILIYEKYKTFPYQVVLYVGDKKIDINNSINFEKLKYNYDVKDIREFNCIDLIESDDIADNIIAVLCDIKDMDKLFQKLNNKLSALSPKKREDYLRKFFYILGLRPKIKEKEKQMPFVIDLREHPYLKEARIEGRIEGKIEGKIEAAKELIEKMHLDINKVAKILNIDEKKLKEALK